MSFRAIFHAAIPRFSQVRRQKGITRVRQAGNCAATPRYAAPTSESVKADLGLRVSRRSRNDVEYKIFRFLFLVQRAGDSAAGRCAWNGEPYP